MTTNVAGTEYIHKTGEFRKINITLTNEERVFCLAPSPFTEAPNTVSVRDVPYATTVVYNHRSGVHLLRDSKKIDGPGFLLFSDPGEQVSVLGKNYEGLPNNYEGLVITRLNPERK